MTLSMTNIPERRSLNNLWHEAAQLAAVSRVIARRFTTLNVDTALRLALNV
jgi:hypothetical protein